MKDKEIMENLLCLIGLTLIYILGSQAFGTDIALITVNTILLIWIFLLSLRWIDENQKKSK